MPWPGGFPRNPQNKQIVGCTDYLVVTLIITILLILIYHNW